MPADGWYEWTGETGCKTAWAVRSKDGAPLWFAAVYDVWAGPGGITIPQVATLTCPPNGDLRHIHDRMGVILSPEDVTTWLTGDRDVARELFRPWPDGRLTIAEARDVEGPQPRSRSGE